jgi:hypothetical protein
VNENAKKWVAALRSGEYQQGKDWLCKDGNYCCLGVACDIYDKDVGFDNVKASTKGEVSYDGESSILLRKVSDYFGLVDRCPYLKNCQKENSLANLNDNGTDFNTIADIIEKHQDTLFITETCNPS